MAALNRRKKNKFRRRINFELTYNTNGLTIMWVSGLVLVRIYKLRSCTSGVYRIQQTLSSTLKSTDIGSGRWKSVNLFLQCPHTWEWVKMLLWVSLEQSQSLCWYVLFNYFPFQSEKLKGKYYQNPHHNSISIVQSFNSQQRSNHIWHDHKCLYVDS